MDIEEPMDDQASNGGDAMEMDDIQMEMSGVGEGDDLAGLSVKESENSEDTKTRNFATDPSKLDILFQTFAAIFVWSSLTEN